MMQSCSIFPLRDATARIVGICIAVQDVTEMVAYEQKLLAMSRTDALTGVFNRRHLEERLRDEFARHTRYRRPLSVVMFDLDNFKLVNDTHGHQCGDAVLQGVATTVAPRCAESTSSPATAARSSAASCPRRAAHAACQSRSASGAR